MKSVRISNCEVSGTKCYVFLKQSNYLKLSKGYCESTINMNDIITYRNCDFRKRSYPLKKKKTNSPEESQGDRSAHLA